MVERLSWDQYFMGMVHLTAMRSPDQSTKIGAVIVGEDRTVLSCGYNGPVRGLRESSNLEELDKYDISEHAERNAIYNAGRLGIKLIGSTLYTTALPCINCARAVIQSGIKTIIYDTECTQTFEALDKEGKYGFQKSRRLLCEAGVTSYPLKFQPFDLIRIIRGTEL